MTAFWLRVIRVFGGSLDRTYQMPKTRSVQLSCPDCGGKKFEISLMKDECVGVTKCLKCERNYLLLDSADYWFDVIQQGQYPRPSRCGCKGTAFQLKLDYALRDDGEVYSVDIHSTCSGCGKSRRQLNIEIDYSPTEQLVNRPLTYCKNPKILYDLREITLYAKRADIAQLVQFLGDAGCHFAGCVDQDGEWNVRNMRADEAAERIVKQTEFSARYMWIYASAQPIKISELAVGTARKGDAFWKRREIIRIKSPTYMVFGSISMRPSLLY